MRIRNQNLLSITIFTIFLIIIVASAFVTAQQTAYLNNQETLSRDIQTRASNLQYLSNDYFLFQDSSGLPLWQTEFNLLSTDISKLRPNSLQQQSTVNSVKDDARLLNSRWTEVASYLENAPRNLSIRIIPAFQAIWSRMALQNQALLIDAQHLSQSFGTEIDGLNSTSLILIFALLGLFGAYFVTYYQITFRNTLRSISELQSGIAVIGSGNLDHTLKSDNKDEIGDISGSINQMTKNLKTVMASKIDLEKEIEERKVAEQALKESEERWSTTLSSIGDSVIATNVSGTITFMNAIAEQSTGWTLSEALGKPLSEVFHIVNEETRSEVESPVPRVLQRGMIIGLANHTILVRKDGSEVPLDDSGAPIKDENGNITGVVLVFHDISERKELERKLEDYSTNLENLVEERTKQLRDAERLASIGATAGMVGHDIRNPLQAITSDVYLAKTELASTANTEEKKNALESLEEIEKNIVYINKIVQDLQDYARPINPVAKETNLQKLIEELIDKNGVPTNIKTQVKVADEAKSLWADFDILKRVLGNLVANAVQAMPEGGKLSINAFKDANDSVITVEDSGVGIPEGLRSKLFTPLFTTKSKGQGFGLAVVKRMTEALGGTVTFESDVCKGTKFIIRLPPKKTSGKPS